MVAYQPTRADPMGFAHVCPSPTITPTAAAKGTTTVTTRTARPASRRWDHWSDFWPDFLGDFWAAGIGDLPCLPCLPRDMRRAPRAAPDCTNQHRRHLAPAA